MPRRTKIPVTTVSRLSVYLRCFSQAARGGQETLSSKELAERTGINSAQVRKDLAYFGQFGRRGVGYAAESLAREIEGILGLDRDWKVVVIGTGRLGTALMMYSGFKNMRFRIVAAFDTDPDKIGWEMEGVPVRDLKELDAVAREQKVDIAILAVPADHARETAALVAAAGIPAVLNFSPARLGLPEGVLLRDVDLTSELEALTFTLKDRKGA
jgi:redox-sensing transcriptional repressor